MKSGGVTQNDVARRAGTSASLVSRILREKTAYISVSEETTNRVRSAAEELGYLFDAPGSSEPRQGSQESGEG